MLRFIFAYYRLKFRMFKFFWKWMGIILFTVLLFTVRFLWRHKKAVAWSLLFWGILLIASDAHAMPAPSAQMTISSDALQDIQGIESNIISLFADNSNTLNVIASSSPAAGSYMLILDSAVDTIVEYIATPALAILFMYYIYEITKRLMTEKDGIPTILLLQRGLVLIAALVLIWPASVLPGINSSQPTAVWLVFQAVDAGMEFGGLMASKAESIATNNTFMTNGVKEIQGLSLPGGDSNIGNFLKTPLISYAFASEAIHQMDDFANDMKKSPHKKSEEQYLSHATTKTGHWLLGLFNGVLTTVTGDGAVTNTAEDLLRLHHTKYGDDVASWLQHEMAESDLHSATTWAATDVSYWIQRWIMDILFPIVLVTAFYLCLVGLIIRMFFYAAIGLVKAFCLPLGEWGKNKLISYLGNIATLFLTPCFLVIWVYVAIAVYTLYIPIGEFIFQWINSCLAGSAGHDIALFVAALVIPSLFFMPCIYTGFRIPDYLGHVFGQVFRSGTNAEGRLKAPLVG